MTTPLPTQPTGGEDELFSAVSFPETYEQALVGPLFDPWVEALLEDVVLGPSDHGMIRVRRGKGALGLVENEPPASRPWRTTTCMRRTPMTRTTNLDPFWVFARARDRPDVVR